MKIKIIDNGMYKMPFRAHANDCGADVYSPKTICIKSHETIKIDLCFALDIPDGYGAFIFPRSSMSANGIVCELPPIDPHYLGNVHAIVSNLTDSDYIVHDGDRIGQLVITPIVIADFVTETGADRGTAAFGSTGK